ncbi:MAG: radical SAM protein [Candidatus Rokubacteria bacterium]|nr:radical SAM protein [Candidatus Rokubacteria bacterium]
MRSGFREGAINRFFLRNFRRTDALFRAFRRLPRALRDRLVDRHVQRVRTAAPGGPDRLTIFLTNQCNMKCAHCFIVKEVQPKLELMSLDDYRRLFRSVRGRVAQVLLTGGEPTLRDDFVDIVLAASREGRIPTVSVFSNGLRPDALVTQLAAVLDGSDVRINVQTSIDGLASFHDVNRRVPGAYRRAVEAIAKVAALGARYPGRLGRVVTATAISRQNLGELEAICDAVTTTGASPAFSFVRTSADVFGLADPALKSDFAPEATKADGSTKFGGDDYLDVTEMDAALAVLARKVWRDDPGRLQFNYNRVTMEAVRDLKATGASPLSAECGMGYDDLVILADGTVSRCEMLATAVALRDYDFHLPRLLAGEPWRRYLGATAGCWCTHDCGIGVSMMKEPALLKRLTPR